jgi:hypothetical protein
MNAVAITSAQLGYLLSGIDWRHPQEPGGRCRWAEFFACRI